MTDNTSPVATLAAKLPKGNGLTRAVTDLHGHNGALVPFIGYLEVEESGEDKNEVLKIKTSIARLELCTGELERDAKDLLARASYAANSLPGQMTLLAEPGSAAAAAEQRALLLEFLTEWQTENAISDADVGGRWTNFSGGLYGPSVSESQPAYIREFLLSVGALKDELAGGDSDPEPDDDATDPDDSTSEDTA